MKKILSIINSTNKKINSTARKSLIAAAVVLAALLLFLPIKSDKAIAGEKSWELSLSKVSGNSAMGEISYRAMQGIGCDTYTGKDGYVFMEGEKEELGYYMLSHFTMDEDGFCTKIYKKKYSAAHIGHANDLTIYVDDNEQKWMIFAPCGLYAEKNKARASDGSALELGAIKLDNNGNPGTTVYSCDVSELQRSFVGDFTNRGNITGVTYRGKDIYEGEIRPIFILMNAKSMYEAYVKVSGNKLKFIPTGRFGRIKKPILPGVQEADTQGIAYHNNYVYLTGEGKPEKGNSAEMAVARISLDTLYSGDPLRYKDMEVYKKNMKTRTVSKHGPEGAFFTSLNDKSYLYIGVNRVVNGVDDDEIMRSIARF